MSDLRAIFEEVLRLDREGRPGVLATLVESGGSTPRHDVARMVIHADGSTMGTIGGGALEHEMVKRAGELLSAGSSDPITVETDLAQLGMVCGGRVKVLLEPVGVAPPLLIFGAGHVAEQVAPVAARCGFSVHVVDDRAEYASQERFPEAVSLAHSFDPAQWQGLPLGAETYCVVVTRGHEHDYEVVRALIERELAYIGMIGSRTKVAKTRRRLAEDGVSEEAIGRMHAPIGLAIGSETPAEIAVSIVAELVRTRRLAQ